MKRITIEFEGSDAEIDQLKYDMIEEKRRNHTVYIKSCARPDRAVQVYRVEVST